MKLIQPNCRVQFAAEDVDFIVEVLAEKRGARECLVQLLADPESRDLILDDEDLFRALLERTGCLRVSQRFYFYILVRHVLLQAGIRDRRVADYVAEVLSEFSLQSRGACALPAGGPNLRYFFEMVGALRAADDRTGFLLRQHIGNYSLFLAGLFPEAIRRQAECRGFPDVTYYENLGRSSFQAASTHRLAQRYEISGLLCTLSERFTDTRFALNDIAERLFASPDDAYLLDRLLAAPGE